MLLRWNRIFKKLRFCQSYRNSPWKVGVVSLRLVFSINRLAAEDCLHYQVDLLAGDPNMALDRATARKEESMDIRGGMYQSIIDYSPTQGPEPPVGFRV